MIRDKDRGVEQEKELVWIIAKQKHRINKLVIIVLLINKINYEEQDLLNLFLTEILLLIIMMISKTYLRKARGKVLWVAKLNKKSQIYLLNNKK